jgi:hypothetical protein
VEAVLSYVAAILVKQPQTGSSSLDVEAVRSHAEAGQSQGNTCKAK